MLGCVPLITKERFSSDLLEEAINWSSVSIRVPPVDMPSLPHVLNATDAEPLRRAAAEVRGRLLWTSIYGSCIDRPRLGVGTAARRGRRRPDAFDTLMQVLRIPRKHFAIGEAHRAPRAPELHRQLRSWLRDHGATKCEPGLL